MSTVVGQSLLVDCTKRRRTRRTNAQRVAAPGHAPQSDITPYEVVQDPLYAVKLQRPCTAP